MTNYEQQPSIGISFWCCCLSEVAVRVLTIGLVVQDGECLTCVHCTCNIKTLFLIVNEGDNFYSFPNMLWSLTKIINHLRLFWTKYLVTTQPLRRSRCLRRSRSRVALLTFKSTKPITIFTVILLILVLLATLLRTSVLKTLSAQLLLVENTS